MLLTRNLKSLLKSYEATLDEAQFKSFKVYLESLITKTITDLKNFAPGPKRGKKIYELLEEEIQKASGVQTTCRAGCSSCCHFEVEITADEADILSELVLTGAKPIDRAKLAMLAAREKQDVAWKKGVVAENGCVFLTAQKTCGVYESRPSSCRRLLVTTDPQECASPDGMPIPIAIPLAEVVLSAAIGSVNNAFGPMAQMLARRLDIVTEPEHFPPLPLLQPALVIDN